MKKHLVEFTTTRRDLAHAAIGVLESKGYAFDAKLSKFALEVPDAFVWTCREVLGAWSFLWTEDQMDDDTLATWKAGHEAAKRKWADHRAAVELEVVRLYAGGMTQRALARRFRLTKQVVQRIINAGKSRSAAANEPVRKEA